MGGGREQPEVGGHRPVEAVSSCVDAATCRQGWEADVKPAAHCVGRYTSQGRRHHHTAHEGSIVSASASATTTT
jgi:hypothetical protein